MLLAILANPMQALAAEDSIDAFIRAEMQTQKIPGVGVAIVRDGEPVRVQGYGFANLEHQVPVHPDTLFQSGSIGKQFTAMAVMLLVEDGKLDLDASVRTYLTDAPGSWSAITLRNLLNHTSGLAAPELDERREYSDEELMHAAYALPPTFPPGRRWEYSNTGYVTLGIIVRKIGGEFYGDVLTNRVFAPLGMRTARVISDEDLVPNRSAGYQTGEQGYRNQSWVSTTLNATADGSLYLSVLDYVQWENGLRKRALLKPASWNEILRPAKLDNGTTYPYGFGWDVRTAVDGGTIWSHGGSWQGFRTYIRRYDTDGVTIVALANSTSAEPGKLVAGIAARYDARYAAPPAQPINDDHPAYASVVERALRRLREGSLTARDFPHLPAAEVGQALDRYRLILKTVGACKPLALYWQRDNGDHHARMYRAHCADGVLQVNATMDMQGVIQRFSLIRIATLEASVDD